ncbi:MAG: stage III sporulation protein AB [Eubacteriales bacterium]
MKFCGCVLVFLGCGYWGWSKGKALERNVSITRDFIQVLTFLQREITQKHRELPSLIKKIGNTRQNAVGQYFKNLFLKISSENPNSFATIWIEENDISQKILEILSPLEEVLGQYDATSQGETILSLVEELKEFQAQQEVETEKMLPVYGALGVTTGLFLVVLLI